MRCHLHRAPAARRPRVLRLEFDNAATFGMMDPGQRVLQSFFLSSMARSGGFSTIDISQLDGSSLLVTDMLMFIGAVRHRPRAVSR